MDYTLGILGAGNMAEAIVKSALDMKVLEPEQIIASDPSEARRKVLANLGIEVTDSNEQVISSSQQIMLAVKPQVMQQAAADLARFGQGERVVLSIMAGVTSQKLADTIAAASAGGGLQPRIIRIMPNTPMLAGQGMSGVARGVGSHAGDESLAIRLFGAGSNRVIMVPEAALDAITAVSGSGPAYVFYLAEAMQAAAEQLGLQDSAAIVRQTILGAATLLAQSPDDAATLRRKVTSPGGTTEAAIKHMQSQHVHQAVADAILAAYARSIELGR